MLAQQLTIVVPTRDRPNYVDRLLRYLVAGGVDAQVLVADSSGEGRAGTERAVALASGAVACSHHAFPYEMPLFTKCFEALKQVQTPLVVLLADDDFIVPTALHAAARRLLEDPSVAVAHGAAMCISIDSGPGIDPMQTLRSRSRRHLVAEQPLGSARVAHWLRQYASIYYSVMRTPRQVESYRQLAALGLDYDFGQLLTGCLALADGTAVEVPGLYTVVMDTAIGASRSPHALIPGWRRLLTHPDFSSRYALVKARVLDVLERREVRADAERVIDDAFVDYVLDRLVNTRLGEVERLKRVAGDAGRSLQRLGAIAARGARALVADPSSVGQLSAPRAAFSRWARALDPMSLDALREGPESATLKRLLASIASYPG